MFAGFYLFIYKKKQKKKKNKQKKKQKNYHIDLHQIFIKSESRSKIERIYSGK